MKSVVLRCSSSVFHVHGAPECCLAKMCKCRLQCDGLQEVTGQRANHDSIDRSLSILAQ